MRTSHSNIQIQVDTREHKSEWDRIRKQFDAIGVNYFRSKLYVGDYASLDNPHVVIDRKKDLLEVCSNVTQQHKRFKAELERAIEHSFRIILLIEHGDGVACLEDVRTWRNPRLDIWATRKVNGKPKRYRKYPRATSGTTLCKILQTIIDKYGVRIEFCSKDETGRRIVELLEGGET